MTAPDAIPPAEGLPPWDTVRLLQASVRCLHFGLASLVPLLGAGIALVTVRLALELLERTGESWDWEPFVLLWLLGGVELGFIHWGIGLAPALLAALVLLATQAGLVVRRHAVGTPTGFNAARREVYWGLGLALSSLVITVLLVGCLGLLFAEDLKP